MRRLRAPPMRCYRFSSTAALRNHAETSAHPADADSPQRSSRQASLDVKSPRMFCSSVCLVCCYRAMLSGSEKRVGFVSQIKFRSVVIYVYNVLGIFTPRIRRSECKPSANELRVGCSSLRNDSYSGICDGGQQCSSRVQFVAYTKRSYSSRRHEH